jgi:hypothetical protein
VTPARRTIVLLFTSLSAACLFAQAPAASGHHEISGIVVSAKSGEPLENTSVTVLQGSNRKTIAQTLTNKVGRFQFSDIADGKYDLVASRRGYVTSAYEQHDGGINTAIVTGDGLVSTGLLFQLEPQGRIFGTVQEDSGDPVPSAQVKLFQKDANGGTGRMVSIRGDNSDSMGNFELGTLSPGKYVICVIGTPWYALPKRSFPGMPSATASGLARLDVVYAPTCYPGTTDPAEAEPIAVAAGEQVSLNLTLHPVPGIHISVPIPARDENGHPTFSPPRVSADIFGTSEPLPTQFSITREDAQGSYTADFELPAGQYTFSFPGQNGDPGRHMTVNADSGAPTPTMTAADPDPIVNGTIQVENGETLPKGSVVWLQSRESAAGQATVITPDGTFAMQSLRPGVYSVGVSSFPIARLGAKGAQVRGHSITVSGEPVQLNIVVRRSIAAINGIVKRNGTPASGVFVLLVPTGAQQIGDRALPNQSDSDGTFNFRRIPPGDYAVVAIENGWKLDWANTDTIKPYLALGQQVRIEPQTREVNLKDSLQPLPQNPQ